MDEEISGPKSSLRILTKESVIRKLKKNQQGITAVQSQKDTVTETDMEIGIETGTTEATGMAMTHAVAIVIVSTGTTEVAETTDTVIEMITTSHEISVSFMRKIEIIEVTMTDNLETETEETSMIGQDMTSVSGKAITIVVVGAIVEATMVAEDAVVMTVVVEEAAMEEVVEAEADSETDLKAEVEAVVATAVGKTKL